VCVFGRMKKIISKNSVLSILNSGISWLHVATSLDVTGILSITLIVFFPTRCAILFSPLLDLVWCRFFHKYLYFVWVQISHQCADILVLCGLFCIILYYVFPIVSKTPEFFWISETPDFCLRRKGHISIEKEEG